MHSWNDIHAGRWSGCRWTDYASGPCVIDPYLVWADLTNFADLDLDRADSLEWIPVLLRLTGPAGDLAATIRQNATLRNRIRIAPMYAASATLASAKFCVAAVKPEAFAALLDEGGELWKRVDRLQLGLPIEGIGMGLPEGGDTQSRRSPRRRRSRQDAIVVGVIDSGFAFANARFRERGSGQTRIEAFWDQGEGWNAPNRRARRGQASRARQRGPQRNALPDVPYGKEFLWHRINDLLQARAPAGLADEDRIYREVGYRGAELRASHGTHVMDLACGYGPADATPPGGPPRIVCVALPRDTTGDTSGLSLGVYALDALRYILDRADRLVPGAKVVVNLSYGNIAGPHDGSSLLEEAIDDLITLRGSGRHAAPLEVVIAAGNNHLSRCHAQFTLAAGRAEKALQWRVLPDDATPSFMEIWLPANAPPADFAVKITSPSGETSGWVQAGTTHALTANQDVLASVIHLATDQHQHLATGERAMILVALAPTATLSGARQVAPAGLWQVRVRKTRGGACNINAWIQRDDSVHGFRRRGRQSYFDDPEYVRFDPTGRPVEVDQPRSYVRRAGTLNAIATGRLTTVVGGYRGSDGAPAAYSASGPKAPGKARRAGPDALSVSERSITRRGVLAAGTRSASTVALNGTSVAAPQVTRWIAEQIAAGKTAGINALRARASKGDPSPKGPTPVASSQRPTPLALLKPKPKKERAGSGRIRSVQRGEDLPDTVVPFVKR